MFNIKITFIVKLVFFLVCTGFFLYNLIIGIQKLQDPPIVTEEKILNISDPFVLKHRPVILICPLDQFNETKLKEYGYNNSDDFLDGLGKFGAWGEQIGWPFEQFRDKVIDHTNYTAENVDKHCSESAFKTRKVFYPSYGYCFEVRDYNLSSWIKFSSDLDPERQFDVHLTDEKLLTYMKFDMASHREDPIKFDEEKVHSRYEVQIHLKSMEDPRNKDSCDPYKRGSYGDCVDQRIQKVFVPKIGCNPPWFSRIEPCEKSINVTDSYKDLVEFYRYYTLSNWKFPEEYDCKQPCMRTLSEATRIFDKESKGKSTALYFNPEVIYTRRVINYGTYEFLAEIGGHLGLWLGMGIYSFADPILALVSKLMCLLGFGGDDPETGDNNDNRNHENVPLNEVQDEL